MHSLMCLGQALRADGDEASDDFRGKLWRPDLSAHEIATESEGEQFYKNLKNKCETLRKKTADARKASGEICNVEIKETKAYVSSGEKFGEANTKQNKRTAHVKGEYRRSLFTNNGECRCVGECE